MTTFKIEEPTIVPGMRHSMWITPSMASVEGAINTRFQGKDLSKLRSFVDLIPAGYYAKEAGNYGYIGPVAKDAEILPITENYQTLELRFPVHEDNISKLKSIAAKLSNPKGEREQQLSPFAIRDDYNVEETKVTYLVLETPALNRLYKVIKTIDSSATKKGVATVNWSSKAEETTDDKDADAEAMEEMLLMQMGGHKEEEEDHIYNDQLVYIVAETDYHGNNNNIIDKFEKVNRVVSLSNQKLVIISLVSDSIDADTIIDLLSLMD